MKSSVYMSAALVLSSVCLCLSARADAIVLESRSGDVYHYGLSIDPGGSPITFTPGKIIELTGLSDITGVTVNGLYPFTDTFNPTSLTLVDSVRASFLSGSKTLPTVYDLFTITSTSSSIGLGVFSLDPSLGTLSGSVIGPAAPTPEPSSLALLGTGLIAATTFAFCGRGARTSKRSEGSI